MVLSAEEKNFYTLLEESSHFWKDGDSMSKKELESWIGKLIRLRWKNEDKVLAKENFDILIEVIHLLTEYDVNDVYETLKQYDNAKSFIWNMPGLEDCEEAAIREVKILTTTEKGVIGAGECKYCSGKELVFTKRQTRRADEGMTIFVRCVTCSRRWRQ